MDGRMTKLNTIFPRLKSIFSRYSRQQEKNSTTKGKFLYLKSVPAQDCYGSEYHPHFTPHAGWLEHHIPTFKKRSQFVQKASFYHYQNGFTKSLDTSTLLEKFNLSFQTQPAQKSGRH